MSVSPFKKWMNGKKQRQLRLLETTLCGIAGGILFTLLHFPLSWMLGSLTSVLVWKLISKRNLHWPASFKNTGQVLLGYSMGVSFTIESARQIMNQLPSMVIVTVLMVIFGLVNAYILSKLMGINIPSAVLGTTPGGLSQMVVLSEEIKGADPTIVTFMQTIRMLTVIFVVPALSIHVFSSDWTQNIKPSIELSAQMEFGSFLQYIAIAAIVLVVTAIAVRFKCPTPWILGPLFSSAILTMSGFETPQLPSILIVIAQLCLGVYFGLSIKINKLRNWRKLLPLSLFSGILTVGFALILSYGLHMLHPITITTAFLCIAPGGLPEMGVTAHAVRADVSMVAAYQLFRVFFLLFIVPIFLRWIFGRHNNLEVSKKSI